MLNLEWELNLGGGVSARRTSLDKTLLQCEGGGVWVCKKDGLNLLGVVMSVVNTSHLSDCVCDKAFFNRIEMASSRQISNGDCL